MILSFINKFVTGGIEYEKLKGKNGSITKFDSDFFVTFGWISAFFIKGSALTLSEFFIFIGGLVVIVSFLARIDCRNMTNFEYCIHLPSPSTTYFTLLTLCAFVVSFFANSVLSRWWAIRQDLGTFMGSGQSIMMNFMSSTNIVIRRQPIESQMRLTAKAKVLSQKLSGYLILTYRLLINSARKTFKNLDDLAELEIITAEETELLHNLKGNQILHALGLVLDVCHEAAEEGLLGRYPGPADSNLMILLNLTEAMRARTDAVLTSVNVQLPYSFVQIVTFVVYASLIQLIYVCSSFVAAGMDPSKAIDQSTNLTTGYLTIILYSFVLLGMLRLYVILENPLGDDISDFPMQTYFNTYKNNIESCRAQVLASFDITSMSPSSSDSLIKRHSNFNSLSTTTIVVTPHSDV